MLRAVTDAGREPYPRQSDFEVKTQIKSSGFGLPAYRLLCGRTWVLLRRYVNLFDS